MPQPPEIGEAFQALTGPDALMSLGELAGGIAMLQTYLASIAEEPATPPALLVTALREINHATGMLSRLAQDASKEATSRHGVAFTDLYRSDDEELTTT